MVFKAGWVLIATLVFWLPARADDKWNGTVPKVAEKPEDWAKLIPALVAAELPYGAMAAARAALNYFADLATKELSYRTIIELVDQGYPFTTRGDFTAGDLEATAERDAFNQSYLLYKGIANLDKDMPKWANYYFTKMDQDNSPKFLFHQATTAYRAKKLPEAITLLKKALAVTKGPGLANLARKEARTLARIYYETGAYDRALDIYETFLLKVDPITPTDWLEAAWAKYQLKSYPEALGYLYNFEGKTPLTSVPLEKFVLRGLIHRESCATRATDALINNFGAQFGTTIAGIKTGEPLTKFPLLLSIEHPEATEYRQYNRVIQELEKEQKRLGQLPAKLRPLALFVYDSEGKMLRRGRQYHQDRALEALARHLVIMDESLRFLKFDVAREKFSPDRVFADPNPADQVPVFDQTDDQNFRLHWPQWGDFWRDERTLYRGLTRTKCAR